MIDRMHPAISEQLDIVIAQRRELHALKAQPDTPLKALRYERLRQRLTRSENVLFNLSDSLEPIA